MQSILESIHNQDAWSNDVEISWLCFPRVDSQPVYNQNAEVVRYLNIGEYFPILNTSDNLFQIRVDTLVGYVRKRDNVIVNGFYYGLEQDSLKKPYSLLLLESWSETRAEKYEELIDQFPKTTLIKRDRGEYAEPQFVNEPLAFMKLLYKTELLRRKQDWNSLIDTWDEIAIKYPDKEVENMPAKVTSLFKKADIYDRQLDIPDSVISLYIRIVKKYPNIDNYSPDGEGHYVSDQQAFKQFIQFTQRKNYSDKVLIQYLEKFSDSSKFVNALVKLQQNEIYLKNGHYDDALKNCISIISGQPLKWDGFKAMGEMRCSALYQWKTLGEKFLGCERTTSLFDTIIYHTSDEKLISLEKYLIADCFIKKGDILSAVNNLVYCIHHQFSDDIVGISVSILPNDDEPRVGHYSVINDIKNLFYSADLKGDTYVCIGSPNSDLREMYPAGQIIWLINGTDNNKDGWIPCLTFDYRIGWVEEKYLEK